MKVNELFIAAFEPTMLQRGYSRKGKVYHRVVNGKIIQLMSYHVFSGGHYLTIQFSVEPLCLGGETSRCFDAWRLSEQFGVPDWEYADIYELEKHMPDVLKKTEQHLLSLFDSLVDYQSYLDNYPRSEYVPVLFEKEVGFANMLQNKYDVYHKSKETYMRDWSEEQEKRISEHIERNRRAWGHDYNWVPLHRKIFEQDCEFFYRMKEAMLADDREAIEKCLKDREDELLGSYIRAFYGKRKYDKFIENGELPFEWVTL